VTKPFKPYQSHKDALGTMLDLIQFRRVGGSLKLSEEELEAFSSAVRLMDMREMRAENVDAN
jgi:hypothetical protein